jgi:hypothetical protein
VGMALFFFYGMAIPFLLLTLFCRTKTRTIENLSDVKNPLIPMHLLKNLNYVTLMICSSMGVMVFYALSIVWPQQIVAIFSKTGTTVGWLSV